MPIRVADNKTPELVRVVENCRLPESGEIDVSIGGCELAFSPEQSATIPVQRREKSNNSKCRVHFFERVTVTETIAVHEMSAREILNSWYRRADFKRMRHQACMIAEYISEDMDLPAGYEDEGIRGIESYIPEVAQKRHELRLEMMRVVLTEQDRQDRQQQMICSTPEETIASLYRELSKCCKEEAAERALCDANETKDINGTTSEEESCNGRIR
mmetsp:Transcript_9065/g.20938  ORF Transcript_9065/g.20938 Transcript_9065/m.20938 type:complete len:215 (+) Transcript_9065:243-887(+)|eukprot:CAMPEP_0116841882 /NCGR_PEP_ID=MMETSP0418-20121206/11199_1 /TAXON_ID=1158023 /ORGANISM="Astrosyne radiata, Strain 13vi08-1A" /LENGTH=214 /DNA_ID=CAMNT_0004472413 /DNA_START=172 /DNA_END=816 /DNA_ORIENTATION=-